ncbi:drug resistance transporter, EmrB/QacA subfamily [Saccharopolyspora antimicrobica]|uniref:Drug resistance transporter, EmrB/QacA subfamily n=1 Tax=Saccharopolyspora antimicrobica TaxID=455193 RepID=A0A1I5LMU3_9PSEU|nr:DHA2 family efflux MFS transporter permease subunit [Saccharopolyspora antimicrobica]RKT87844.1 EmrB/QacA subfamily drug resistance transporter [Saccharopolyspora antimicrobica]SFO98669.1 drug resistance transporter, EmrB/QacA subfamily [Saccharopolyspora antimicrobica]
MPVPHRRYLVLGICCFSLFLVSLDTTIVNLALPEIEDELDAPLPGLQWTIDAYTVVLASLLLLAGSVADRFGRRRVFRLGLIVFTTASLLCGIAPTVGWLIGFRVLQAIGASMLNPVALSIIVNTFPDARERARAIGIWSSVVGLSMAVGPVTGGLLVDSTGWRSIFWINIPAGIAALVLTSRFVPESRSPRPRRFDPAGQLLVIVALASLVFGIIEGPHVGWTAPATLGCFLLSALATVVFVRHEKRREQPLLDLRLFASAPMSGATVIALCGFAALSGFLFLNSLYLQDVRGFSALEAGLLTLPMAAPAILCAPVAARLIGARGPRIPLVLSGAGIALSGVVLAGLEDDTPLPWLIAGYALFGLGFGMLNAPVTATAVAGLPAAQAGVAAAVASTSRQIGASLGAAVLPAVVAVQLEETGFGEASRPAWWIVAGCGLLIGVIGSCTTGRWGRRTAETTAAALAAA